MKKLKAYILSKFNAKLCFRIYICCIDYFKVKIKKILKKLSKLISSTKYKCSAFSFSSVGLTAQNT